MSKKDFFRNIEKHVGDEFNIQEAFNLVKYDTSVYWSWGAHNVVNLLNKGLMFKVNGYLHKGFVLVTYNTVPDLYSVTLLNGQYNEVKKYSHIYCDELQQRIDNLVERQPEYRPISKPKFS